MKAFTILSISHRVNKLGEDKGIAIAVQGYEDIINRSTKQFLTELQGSNLVGRGVTNIDHPFVLPILRGLSGGTVHGNVDWFPKGSKYTISADHPSLTDDTREDYGTHEEGDEVEREGSGFYIEYSSMLSYKPSPVYEFNLSQATALAMQPSLESMFGGELIKSERSDDNPPVIEDNSGAAKEPADIVAKPVTKRKKAAKV